MKKPILLLILVCFLFSGKTAFPWELDALDFLELSLEDQLKTYFDTFRDGHTYKTYYLFAGYIAGSYGISVIPYLKEYLKDADFFSLWKNPPLDINPNFYLGEPNDITLELIACIWSRLHSYTAPVTSQRYALDETEIQWFVSEYKRRIDEYILAIKAIDRTVLQSETMIAMIAAWGSDQDNDKEIMPKYGHPGFDVPYVWRGSFLKEYYEQRLGICDLIIDYSVFRE